MARIVSIAAVESVKAGPDSTVLADGTIEKPEPYHAADIEFDDDVVVQVERPLDNAKIVAARGAVTTSAKDVDGFKPGDVIN